MDELSMEVRVVHFVARKEALRMTLLELKERRLKRISFSSFQKLQIRKISFERIFFFLRFNGVK